MELMPIVDDQTGSLALKGFAERKWAEQRDLCHLTTLLIPVFSDHTVLVQVRPPRKSFPGCRDIFGGHVTLNQEFWPLLLGQPFSLSDIITAAAIREANEELRINHAVKRTQYVIAAEDLVQIGDIGAARWEAKGNVERSTLFLVLVRTNHAPHPMDDVEREFVPVETERQSLEQIRREFLEHEQIACKDKQAAQQAGYDKNKADWQFADGAARVVGNHALFDHVSSAVATLSPTAFDRK